jgi:formylglycine-generating enzyme required for sulfatase activity
MTGKRVGLVIGNNYPEWDKEKQLKFAVADAEKIKEILENKDICGFDEVIYLPDRTSKEASSAIEKILRKAEDDLVFIYFSGHGKKDFENNLCLLFNDTNEDALFTTSLTFDFITKCMRYPSRKSVIIILDCCYSGAAGIKDTDVTEALKKHSEALKEQPGSGTIIITSTGSTGSTKAREDEKFKHGIFTNFLIEGLEKGTADENGDGYISIDDLYDYAFGMTTKISSQSPKKEGSIEGTVFIGKNPLKIKEKEFKRKREKLLEIFGDQLPSDSDIVGECLAILRKFHKTPSLLEKEDKIILGCIESLLKNNLLPEKRGDAIQNCIDAVQYKKEKEEQERKRREVEKTRNEEEKARKEKEEQERKQREEEKARKEKEEQERKQHIVEELHRRRKEKEEIERKQREEEKARKEIPRTFTSSSTGMQFVLIPAGEFVMGSPPKEKGGYGFECPVHKVTIKDPFYLGKYPVTQKQWIAVMGNNPSSFKDDNLPVQNVLWSDVQKFIRKLNEVEGTDKYRLPSEAEWEYACRAGTTTSYSFGDDESNLGNYAWYWNNSDGKTHPIGQKKPNDLGLHDMHGNVWEWVQDRWHDDYKGAPSDGSAWEGGDSSSRVLRGGSWNDFARDCRSAIRDWDGPGSRGSGVGFRLLRKL